MRYIYDFVIGYFHEGGTRYERSYYSNCSFFTFYESELIFIVCLYDISPSRVVWSLIFRLLFLATLVKTYARGDNSESLNSVAYFFQWYDSRVREISRSFFQSGIDVAERLCDASRYSKISSSLICNSMLFFNNY